jgi:hypothetical protein
VPESAGWIFRYFSLNNFPARADNIGKEEVPLSEEVMKKPVSQKWQELFREQ